MLEKGAINKCKPCKNQYLSKFFLRKKADGSYRFILNLEGLNEFIKADHFKMENVKAAEKLLALNYFIGSIDLKDAYFLIPVHVDSRKYLRFQFLDQLYEFTCLPFGLNVSPWVYTKVMKTVVNYLRNQGYMSVIYLDDIMCIGHDFNNCEANIRATVKLLQRLGFIIHFPKSTLTPTTRCKYLGVIIDSKKFAI